MPDQILLSVIPSPLVLLDANNIRPPGQVKQTYFMIDLLHAKPYVRLSSAIYSSVSTKPNLP